MTMPNFVNEASCAYDQSPDDWFPDIQDVIHLYKRHELRDRYSHTPSAMRARTICMSCPAYDECLEYSLAYKDLYGIWAGLDAEERKAEQLSRGIKPSTLPPAYVNEIPQFFGQGDTWLPVESEWDNVQQF